ncbi:MFS transporter [Companilactobacillus mishanensis]|uniref:MFS transporter n=1 Tax=Companilactobacillus mishanensis TaxID=2486008 RepID=A0ABW9P9K1_9LACO|nr:MFS transporter [Companilactobacillus mishanensis]
MNRRSKYIVTFALILSNAMAGLDATIINTALPAIVSDLHAIQYMGWIVAIFLLGMAVATPLWSKFGEKKGNKTAYITSTIVFMVGALFQGLATNITWFIIARAFMGIGAGGMNTIPFIIYSQMFKNIRRRAQVIGVAAASFSGTSIIGPLLGGWIVDTFSWHWVFYINLPLALLSILIVVFYFKIKQRLNKAKIDYKGATLMVFGLVSILIGIQELGVSSIFVTLGFILVGILLVAWMVKAESKAVDPIVPNRLFKNAQLVVDMLLFALLWGAFVAFNIYVPMWAQGIMGLSALIGGMTQIPGSITNFIGSELGPILQRPLGRYNIISIGTASFLVAFIGLFIAGQQTSYTFLLIMGMFEGFGLGLCFNVLQVAVQSDAEPRDVPIATSFAYLVRILAQTFMSSIYGVILNHALFRGVAESHGQITMAMMNRLSDSKAAKLLPQHLLPEMRTILFSGIHNIFLTALILLVAVSILLVILYKMGFNKTIKSHDI